MNKIGLFLVTISYMKFQQLYYRLYYFIRSRVRLYRNFKYTYDIDVVTKKIKLEESIFLNASYENGKFTFLNKAHIFKESIFWNYAKYGKLWTYNLSYFDFLSQKNISSNEGHELINRFISEIDIIQDGMEPFPISLRGINWIKFLVRNKINECDINNCLYAQYHILLDNLEYHLLGNHLLENGFSLLYAAYYFDDNIFLLKARNILFTELNEQILDDGAHFELSPMYHQIMLFRILDCINLLQNNKEKNNFDLLTLLKDKASLMLGWLKAISYETGEIPLFNDSAYNITPDTFQLLEYAERLNIKLKNVSLNKSGYRKFSYKSYQLIVDVGDIGPDYIPGHAHADTFNFELQVHNKPFIVDTGISTYEANDRRQLERSTESHNTVVINKQNQSQVWGGFRVGHRAKVTSLKEGNFFLIASHDGYRDDGITHTRKFIALENFIEIRDNIKSKDLMYSAQAYFHFSPSLQLKIKDNNIITSHSKITFEGYDNIVLKEYNYAPEFNKLLISQVAVITFRIELKTKILIYEEENQIYENN